MGRKGIVERSPLIRHTTARRDDLQRQQSNERSTTNTDNQAFLKDVSVKFKLAKIIRFLTCKKYKYNQVEDCIKSVK